MSHHEMNRSSLSLVEQGMNDRLLFEIWYKNQSQPPVPEYIPVDDIPRFTEGDAVTFLDELTPKLADHYSWVQSADTLDVARLLNEMQDIREGYFQKKGEQPTDDYIYRKYRMETASVESQSDDFSHRAVLLLDAIMSVDTTNNERVLP